MSRLRLIKGGKPVDLTEQVLLKFAERFARAVYYNQKVAKRELLAHLHEHDIKAKEHVLLLEILEHYNWLMDLGEVPFKYITEFRDFLEVVEEDEKSIVNE